MTCRITGRMCSRPGCSRPVWVDDLCSQHARLAQAFGARTVEPEPSPGDGPQWVAYLSTSGDVMTIERAFGPLLTIEDVEAAIDGIQQRRRRENTA